MRRLTCLCVLCALALGGCINRQTRQECCKVGFNACNCPLIASRLDRGDWQVNERTAIWKVNEQVRNLPPQRIGYVLGSEFRQLRGGPTYTMYTVTTLDRRDQIGRIDQMGNAIRYEPRRDGGFEEVSVGTGTLEDQVAAIFDTRRIVRLERTTERKLAFEKLDTNGDGVLEGDEVKVYGARLTNGDVNRDGKVDYPEFEAIDIL